MTSVVRVSLRLCHARPLASERDVDLGERFNHVVDETAERCLRSPIGDEMEWYGFNDTCSSVYAHFITKPSTWHARPDSRARRPPRNSRRCTRVVGLA